MTRFIITLFITGFAYAGYGQHDFLFTKKTLGQVRAYEDSVSSKYLGLIKTQVAQDYFPTAADGHDYFPLSFVRTNDPFFPNYMLNIFTTKPIQPYWPPVMTGISWTM